MKSQKWEISHGESQMGVVRTNCDLHILISAEILDKRCGNVAGAENQNFLLRLRGRRDFLH